MRQERSMNPPRLVLAGAVLTPLPSGALWWEAARLLCVSDLHLGKCLRSARGGGAVLPPYETMDTLTRLDADLATTAPATVVCLGDSFDDDLGRAQVDRPGVRAAPRAGRAGDPHGAGSSGASAPPRRGRCMKRRATSSDV
jgi:uncharacterized protein